MNNLPRQKLQEIVAKYGNSLCSDSIRCKGLLNDICGEQRKEIFVLVNAIHEKVPEGLHISKGRLSPEVVVARFSKQLQDNLGISEDVAFWAVESWALALGVISPAKLSSFDSGVKKSVSPQKITPHSKQEKPSFDKDDFKTIIDEYKLRINSLAPVKIGNVSLGIYDMNNQWFPIKIVKIENWAKAFDPIIDECVMKLNMEDARDLKANGGTEFDLYTKLKCVRGIPLSSYYHIVWNNKKYKIVSHHLRSVPANVSDDRFQKFFKLNKNKGPLKYVENAFKDDCNGTVSDLATGLMWQKLGSGESMNYESAKAYISDLNDQTFANYSNWRLPTIEELMSLLEPSKNSNRFYIDPVFYLGNSYFWSSDTCPSSIFAWYVNFYSCKVKGDNFIRRKGIRAVRTMHDND